MTFVSFNIPSHHKDFSEFVNQMMLILSHPISIEIGGTGLKFFTEDELKKYLDDMWNMGDFMASLFIESYIEIVIILEKNKDVLSVNFMDCEDNNVKNIVKALRVSLQSV